MNLPLFPVHLAFPHPRLPVKVDSDMQFRDLDSENPSPGSENLARQNLGSENPGPGSENPGLRDPGSEHPGLLESLASQVGLQSQRECRASPTPRRYGRSALNHLCKRYLQGMGVQLLS